MLDPRLNHLPDQVKTIHIMGICGTGMAALAGMLQHTGYTVTGSDSHVYPPMSDFLARINIAIMNGYRSDNIQYGPDLVIVGNVITKNNPEAVALSKSGIPYLSFPQALAELFIRDHKSIVICGTHGKTTTCSLLASSLYHGDLDPSFMIGGIVSEFNENNRIGNGSYFVTEGDEYDTAFFDKESKFLHYRPDIAILTSIEFDHADIFDNLDQIKRSFAKFIALMPTDGKLLAHLDDPHVKELVQAAPCQVEGYGFGEENSWRISSVSPAGQETNFTVHHPSGREDFTLPLSGDHNCLNATAVVGVMHHLGCPFPLINDCLQKFKGVKRRQEVRGEVKGITIIDDFAHHPTAVRETLSGLKRSYGERRLVAVFEPRTNSSRRAIFQHHYEDAFSDADVVLVREPIPLQNVPREELFSSEQLASALRERTCEAHSFADTDKILSHLQATSRAGDVVAILSNGGFDDIHERFIEMLKSTDL